VLTRETNAGFARAFTDGVQAAAGELIFSMNSDVVVRPGFLEPLIARVGDARIFAAVPRTLLNGDAERCESLVRLCLEDGGVQLEQPSLSGEHSGEIHARVVPFAIGGAFLFSKRDFQELGGFDPLFEPFYLEDLDLSWRAARRGQRIVLEPDSIVEHHHRGTIGRHVPERVVRAAIERNLLLFLWKHLDDPLRLEAHLEALLSRAISAHVEDRREELIWLCLALEEIDRVLASRAALPAGASSFEQILRASD
jgi:GT2 family glycosyltransferase